MKRKNPGSGVDLHIGNRKKHFDTEAEAYRYALDARRGDLHSEFAIVDVRTGIRREFSRAGKRRNPDEPKKGQRYLHSKWLDSTYEVSRQKVPQLYEITKVSGGTVYSRPIYATGRKGAAVSAALANFERYVKEYVSHNYKPPAPEYTDFKGNPNAADEYVRKTRHPERKRYAAAWLKHLRGGPEPNSDDYKGLSYMARQGVRLSLDELVENKQNPKRNPEAAAKSMRKAFTGLPSKKSVIVARDIHVHGHLAKIGELVELRGKTVKGEKFEIDFTRASNPRRKAKGIGRKVAGWVGRRAKAVAGVVGGLQRTWINPKANPNGPVLLASNEAGSHLFIEGGDQSLDLSKVGLDAKGKESIIVGPVTHVTYHARKKFDGKEEEHDYEHKFSEDSGGPLPQLRYDVKNKHLFLDGGVYHIPRALFGASQGITD